MPDSRAESTSDDRLRFALRQTSDTASVTIRPGALDATGVVFRECFKASRAVIVADERTMAAAGEEAHERLQQSGVEVEEPIVLPGTPEPYADLDTVERLEAFTRFHSAVPVAAGAGTINDTVKLASFRTGRPYMCVATASSMDGYAAFGAAITRDGFKETVSCPAPRAILGDLDVLIRAPRDMNSTGYGDLLGKVTAGADWILADALECEPIDQSAWFLVQDPLRGWLARPDGVRAAEPRAVEDLFNGLIMSGLAMQLSRSSRPASGSEHRFSHLWEMQALAQDRPTVPHGFKVGVGTIAAAALYERVLARDLGTLDIESACRAWPSQAELERGVRQAHAIPQLGESAVRETLAKYVDVQQLRQRLSRLRRCWPAISRQLRDQLLPVDALRRLLRDAGCPVHPEEIGVSLSDLKESHWLARTIRRRYTILDLAYEAGILAECVDELFRPGGFWSGRMGG